MVTFTIASNPEVLSIKVNGEQFGYIGQGQEFFMGQRIRIDKGFSSDDFREIAKKIDEVAQYGVNPPKCPECHNTPNFPEHEFDQEKQDVVACSNEIHSRQFHHTGDWLR